MPKDTRLEESGPARLTVKELTYELSSLNIEFPKTARKQVLIDLLIEARTFVSAEEAAEEKACAGESLAVEHVAELGPDQTSKARSKAQPKTQARKRRNIEVRPNSTKRPKFN